MAPFLVVAALLPAASASAETRAIAIDVVVDDRPAATTERIQSRVVYLNRGGVTLTTGTSDARTNRSSIVSGMVAVPAWNPSAEVWSETVACLHEMFAPFDVRFTETDPGATSHIEAVFGGNGSMIGLPYRPAGVAPMSTTCRPVENAIVFAFTDDLPAVAQTVCEVMAQEIAHSYGLDHELLASDPMSYLPFRGNRAFQDTVAECGETSARACGVPGYASCRPQQNSYALLMERLGPAGAEDAPSDDAMVPRPDDGDSVPDELVPDEIGCNANTRPGSLAYLLALAMASLRRRRLVR